MSGSSIHHITDDSFEPDEGFLVTLSDPVGAQLGNSTTRGTIFNDD